MHCRRDGSAMHGTNYSPLDHFHSPTIQSTILLCKRISIEQSIKSDRYHSALEQPVQLCPRAKLPAYYPFTHANNVPRLSYLIRWLLYGFFTLILVVLRTGCGIVEHIDFLQRIVLYRIHRTISQPNQSMYYFLQFCWSLIRKFELKIMI